jgi:hypothetical protein
MDIGRSAYNLVSEDIETDFPLPENRSIHHALLANVAASMVARGCIIFGLIAHPEIYALVNFILSVSYYMIYNYYFVSSSD